ncbi:MAG: DUF2283 domain-containing protein [Magnetococcus sp. YQC-5]
MKVIYNPEVDVLRVVFSDTPIDESESEKSGIILDYDQEGRLVGMEILNASQCMEHPWSVECALAG